MQELLRLGLQLLQDLRFIPELSNANLLTKSNQYIVALLESPWRPATSSTQGRK